MEIHIKNFKVLLISSFLALTGNLFAQNQSPFQYISPKPGSMMVSNETNIILKHSEIINRETLSSDLINVRGEKSGIHSGELILSDDNRTIVFNLDKPFTGDEEVNVDLMNGIKILSGTEVGDYSFGFTTAETGKVQRPDAAFDESSGLTDIQNLEAVNKSGNSSLLPAPPITIDSISHPSPGYIFMATWDRNVPALYGNFIFILDKNGAIVDSVRVNGAPYDFQVQQNGLLSYALGDFKSNVPLPGEELRHIVLDENLQVVDSFKMKNGYITDFHEFKMLPNGHVMMMSYHTIVYDMSKIVEGGKTDASLVINIIQEQDRNKNVVFEWRNIDHIPITDSDLDLTASRINYGTLNAFDIDDDGNILASFRNHSEIIKISRTTGEVIWRMGGPRGEFTYVGEHEENAPYYHARQHNIRRRPNGNITMFDNGEFHMPPYSRTVEYSLDEVNKVATLVSEWRYPNGNIFCVTAGNSEPLTEGGWFIGYGVPNPQFVKRNAVEVHPDGSIALELSLPRGVLAYRVYKFPWKEYVQPASFTNFEVKEGNTYSYNNDSITTGIDIAYTSLSAADYNESIITRLSYGPVDPEFIDDFIDIISVSIIYEGLAIDAQNAEFSFDLATFPEIKDPENTMIYYRPVPSQGLFIPISTVYDTVGNELKATLNGFGEIVFGVTMQDTISNIPILYEPLNQQKLVLQDSITVRWTGKGFYHSFNIQVSTDSTFTTILHEANTNLSDFYLSGLTNHMTYYWRVNSVLNSQSNQWSEIWSFEITDPFIRVVSPNGGEIWNMGHREIIYWETNILEKVHIDLLQDDFILFSLDTIQGSHQAMAWNIPANLQPGDNYKIQVISESNTDLSGISENVFSIKDAPTGIVESENFVPHGYSLGQNFPNPFKLTTTITYSIQKSGFVTLHIYDLTGRKVRTLVDEFQEYGVYSTYFKADDLPSGIYFYKLRAREEFVGLKKMQLIR